MSKVQKQEVVKTKNIGLELTEKDIDLVDGNLVASGAVTHQGQYGYLKLRLEGSFSLKPFIHKAIDWLEEKVPGDQTVIATILKTSVDNIKF